MTSGRTIRLRYYVYRATTTMGPYVPVYVIYLLDQGYSVGFVALTQAVFSVVMLSMELPAGYVSDRLGRRWTLLLSNAFRISGVLGYVVFSSAGGYLFVKVLTGTAWAFRSGALDAWLYELLGTYDDSDEFARVSGRGRTAILVTSAAGAVVGGVLYGIDHRLPFLLTAAIGALTIPNLLTFPSVDGGTDDQPDPEDGPTEQSPSEDVLTEESPSEDGPTEQSPSEDGPTEESPSEDVPADEPFTARAAVETLRVQVRRPAVRWVGAYSLLLLLVFNLSRTFEQPSLDAVGVSVASLGVLYAGFKLVSAAAASTTGWLTDRLGVRDTLALIAPVVAVAYGAVAVVPVAVVPVLFLYRGVRSVFKPVRNQYLNDRLADAGRATVLSGLSMITSIVTVGARLLGGKLAMAFGPVTFLAGAGALLGLAAGGLWLATSPVHSGGTHEAEAVTAD